MTVEQLQTRLIRDRQAVHPLARIYLARALDPVIEVAQAVARDFDHRPGRYAAGPADLVRLFRIFQSQTGTDPEWPDAARRARMSATALRRFYGGSGVFQGFAGLRLAAIQGIESLSKPEEPTARRSFTEAAGMLRADVEARKGVDHAAIERVTGNMLTRALAVLTSPAVAGVFAAESIPAGAEPADALLDPRLGSLCGGISTALGLPRPVTPDSTAKLQRAGLSGATTLAEVLGEPVSDPGGARVTEVMHMASEWAAALRDLVPGVDFLRAWEDPEYRDLLHPLERDIIPPHPAGEIDLEGTIRTEPPRFGYREMAFSTITVDLEICCCSGDLGCTNGQCTVSDDCPTLTSILT